jgi:DNA-binding response OmpR family regulator
MPGLTGEELVLTLNAMLGEKMPTVIMVSSSPDISNIVANSRIQAWQVFTKPLMENRFVDAIEQVVAEAGKTLPEPSGNILLVEDEKINAEMMHQMLTNMGYIAKVAHDGETMLTLVDAFKFDCILLDVHLPDMDGFAILERLKRKDITTPVIIVSGDTTDDIELKALEAGVRYCLFKPVPFQELKNTLRLTLSRAKQLSTS